ncbi:hypothetical protein J2S74_005255 [Evansella vedderi]|uniref:Uncharacterized protein n=1 Tax=Evansella vedderi TaxID=38282 RepID=A0ABU0A2S5_9BACI|nr:hypothetical protein [Evansella vedderi]MDQ0257793.1 hypothetical protein [Evansella vedderi]
MTQWIILGSVTRSSTSFHNPGHIRIWYESPLRNFEPHLVTALLFFILVFGVGYFIHINRKEHLKEEGVMEDVDEKKFQELATKKNILLNKILQVEEDFSAGVITEKEMEEKVEAYKKYLFKVKSDLNKYIE